VVALKPSASLVALPFFAACLVLCAPAHGQSVRGSLGAETQIYPDAPLYPDQNRDHFQVSTYATLNASADLGNARFDMELFGRIAPDATKEASGDVRQAFVRVPFGNAEVKAGILTEKWGVLEAWNPVDIINQSDLIEDFQGKVKLGQPGVLMTLPLGDATVSFFGTNVARSRRFGQDEDRFQVLPARVVDEHFEGGRSSPTGAIRVELPIGPVNVAVSQFIGTAREPVLTAVVGPTGLEGFRASYERISQTSFEAALVLGDSVIKTEVIHQRTNEGASWGGGVGIETSFSKIANGPGDLTLYAEAYGDSRADDAAVTPFQRDVFLGARYTFNDTDDTLLELRNTHDLEWGSDLIELRASRRVLQDAVFTFSLLKVANEDRDPALSSLSRDTQIKLQLAQFF